MRALVTGAYGFVGPHMIRLLVENGYEVIATDHPSARPKLLPAGVQYQSCDLTDYAEVARLITAYQPSLEFLIASIFRYDVPSSVILKTNSLIKEKCLRATLRRNPRIEHVISWISASVYGESFKTATPENPLTEDAPMVPRNAYEWSKLLQHQTCRQYYGGLLPITEIFPMAIYGPGGNYGALVVVDMMAKNQLPGFPCGGHNRISLVHVEDVCGAALFLARRSDTLDQHYNLGDASVYTIKDLMIFLRSEFARLGTRVDLFPVNYPMWLMRLFAWRSEQLARKNGHPPLVQRDFLGYFEEGYNFLVNTEKIRKLGFRFNYNDPMFSGGLRETLEWQKKEELI